MTICFIDAETRSPADVTVCGAYTYAHHPETDVLVWAYAFDDEPVQVWSPTWCWRSAERTPEAHPFPSDLVKHVRRGGLVVAWNAFFDRLIWNQVMVKKYGWPELPIDQVLCAQAQAEANNLPGAMEKAAIAVNAPINKDLKGKQLIGLLSTGTREDWDSEKFETSTNMGHFRSYCAKDVDTMRAVWKLTRPLTQTEWDEYHVSERINERGVMVDLEFAKVAQRYAQTEAAEINTQLAAVTQDPQITLTTHLRKAAWLHEQLWPSTDLQELTQRPTKEDEKPRYSCDRPTREAVLEMILQPEQAARFERDQLDRIVEFLELIEAGNSAAVRKFTAIVNQAYNERVYGSYSFNGGGQTGRFSSRGIQVHNIIRAPVDKDNPDRAIDAIEAIISGADADSLREQFGYPISRLLARLIRPTFITMMPKTLVWADWDQIEGRILPWLADTAEANAKLDQYRRGEDVYRQTAADVLGEYPQDIDGDRRQIYGKVPELALGFGGAVGALTAMARGYGVVFTEEEKSAIVENWRRNNAWARYFWYDLWSAAMGAYQSPGQIYRAGRIRYIFITGLIGGSLVCILPDDRLLVYPQFKHEYIETEVEHPKSRRRKDKVTSRWITSFMKGFGSGSKRVEIWHGTLAENVTQATAASILRLALTRLDPLDCVVLHTHDEIVAEAGEHETDWMKDRLRDAMTILPEWAEGLPLTVSIESGPFYTK